MSSHATGAAPPSAAMPGAARGPVRPAPGGRVYNFNAGPAAYPVAVLERLREELADFRGLGAGIMEISHRSPQFGALLDETDALLRRLLALPDGYRIVYTHGGGAMQWDIVALNLLGLRPARKALYVDTGSFAARAAETCMQYGYAHVVASSRNTGYDRIPALPPEALDPAASYLHICTNNTAMGTRWPELPQTGALPLVGDLTSEIGARVLDFSRFGLVYAGAQKNLGPPGTAVVIVREDLLGHALPHTPMLLDLALMERHHSLYNTLNTFTLCAMRFLLAWLEQQGGVAAIERVNEAKAAALYGVIDASGGFYRGYALPACRSRMNVTFDLPDAALRERFIADAAAAGLTALRGHSARGGIRASIYNAMPLEGAQALAQFMTEFQRRHG